MKIDINVKVILFICIYMFGFKSSLSTHEKKCEKALKETITNKNDIKQIDPISEENSKKKNIFREAIVTDGAKVQVTVDSFEHSIFQMRGEGFKANESLTIMSNSCNEVLYFSIKADEHGNIPNMQFLPAVIGKDGGICHIDILRGKDSVHLKLPWGTEILKNN